MAEQGSEEEDRPQSLTEETTTTNSTGTLIPPLPTLPFDVQSDILCRLPVKLLVQLRCLSKSYNSLISDPKFAKKHLRLSTKRHHLMFFNSNNSGKVVMYDSLVTSVFSASTVPQTQLSYLTLHYGHATALCSCDGIFCAATDNMYVILWNPSLRKHKILPPLDKSGRWRTLFKFGFGYDRVIDNYKTIAVSNKNEVSVNVLGTDYWRKMLDFPHHLFIIGSGKFVTGTVNWLAWKESILQDSVNEVSDWNPFSTLFILSLDLEKESYQEFPKPDLEMDSWTLGVVKDWLCIFAKSKMFLDVWIMKEYGNKESWTKLYSVPNMQHQGLDASAALYISEDDRLLVHFYGISASSNNELVVYDSKSGTLNIPEFQNKCLFKPQVYIESLITP